MLFTNYNLLINYVTIFSTNDFKNSSWVFTILWFTIIFSLFLSFMFTTSPIISVLSLLLLSISAVFLWFFETQFLFIYLVYILAFIGAVLMLFLSVVLMLPISMLRVRNTKFISKNFVLLSVFNFEGFLDYNFSGFFTSSSFIVFIIIILGVFFTINVWNYIKSTRKFDLDFYSQYYSNYNLNTNFIGYDFLFLVAEFFVAVKQNFIPNSNIFVYDRSLPLHNSYNNKFLGQLYNRSSISLSRIYYNLKAVNYNFLQPLPSLEALKIRYSNKYITHFLYIYSQLDFIYSIFVIRNKLSGSLNLSSLSWKSKNSSFVETKVFMESNTCLCEALPNSVEFYFSDYFLNKYSGILPNRFFFIFNLGFIPTIWNKFDFINFIYKPFTSVIPETCNFNIADFSLTKVNIFEKLNLNAEKSSIILKYIVFFEVFLKVISSVWLFSFYIILGSLIPSFIFYGFIYDIYTFFKLDGYFFRNINQFGELIIQFILLLSVIVVVLPFLLTTLIPENFIIINSILLKFTGLSSIKFLLYEFNGLSLILSTFVLLIALIGASTLTKK